MRTIVVYSTRVNWRFAVELEAWVSAQESRGGDVKNNYPDGQPFVKLRPLPPKNSDVIVIGNTQGAQQLVELLTLIDTVRRNKSLSSKLIVVIPYFGAGRQDRAKKPGDDMAAEMQASLISAMLPDAVLLMDLHNSGIVGFFNKRVLVREIYAEPVFVSAIQNLGLSNFVFVSPDAGRLDWARSYAEKFGVEVASLDKRREGPGKVKVSYVVGSERVGMKNAVLVDDILDTGNTVLTGAAALLKVGALNMHLVVTHAVLSGEARFKFSLGYPFASLHTTDTIADAPSNFKVHSVVPLFAKAIQEILG